MPKSYHLILSLLFAVFACASKGAALKDTALKNLLMPLMNTNQQMPDDLHKTIKVGVTKIQHDSIAEGLNMMMPAVNELLKQSKFDRIVSPLVIEFVDIFNMVAAGQLNKHDQKIAYEVIKAIASGGVGVSEKKIDSDIEKSPETNFIIRLKVIMEVFGNKKNGSKKLLEYLNKDSTLIVANMAVAQQLYDNDKYDESLAYYARLIQLKPDYAIAYNARGKSYAQLNQSTTAIADYNKALELFPTYVEANYNKADALIDLDNYREAVDNYLKMYRVKPEYRWCLYNLARAYKGLKVLDSALYYINAHIKENPDDGDGYDIKGDIYAYRDEFKNALVYYNQAVKLNPKKRSFYEDRGDAYLGDNQFDNAINDFNKSVSLDNKRSYPISRLGDCYYFANQFEKSISYYKKAIALSPRYKYCYQALNRSYTQLKNYPEAITNGLKAVEIDSTYASGLGNLGWTYYCAGDYEKCIIYSYRALKFDQEATYAMFNIALATLRQGKIAEANQLYKSFINTCQSNHYEINDGAVDDLKDMIKAHVYEKEAQFIIDNIFGKISKNHS